jgi:2'-5' RNA ligase
MRVFVGLDLEDKIRQRISEFVDEVRELAPGVRWVSPESLHVTLKFIGERPEAAVKDIEQALASAAEEPFQIHFRGVGFFPTANSARVFWVGIDAGPGLAELAKRVEASVAGLGIPEEKRGFSPHLTLARAGGGSGAPGRREGDKPNRQFVKLQEKLGKIESPDFGTMTAREFFLYRSQLSKQGSRYTKIARFEIRGINR